MLYTETPAHKAFAVDSVTSANKYVLEAVSSIPTFCERLVKLGNSIILCELILPLTVTL